MLVERFVDSISPAEVKQCTDSDIRVYLFPRRGDRVYRLSSDGEIISVCLVESPVPEDPCAVQGYTCESVHTGPEHPVVLQLHNGPQGLKVLPVMAFIYATATSHWTDRITALEELGVMKARKRPRY